MARDLVASTIPDEDYYDGDQSLYDQPESVNTDGATKGSDGVLSNAAASHSTVIIRSPIEKEVPSLVPDSGSDDVQGLFEPATPPQPESPDTLEPPPAYTGSVRSTRSTSSARRASYAERNNLTTGTVLGEADLGTGVDTIRPVKKVDTVRSLRLSEEYVGNLRKERSGSVDGSAPTSPVSPKGSANKRPAGQHANAGRAMVNEVLLPTLEKVCPCFTFSLMFSV